MLCSALLTACTQTTHDVSDSGYSSSETVSVVMPKTSENSAGFDPMHGWGCGEHTHDPLIQSTLFKCDEDGNVQNELASEYSYEDGGKVLVVTLREDAYFSDGTQLKAKDVAFTIEAQKNSADSIVDLSYVKSVEARSDFICAINLETPNQMLLYTLCFCGIVPSESYIDGQYGKKPVGSGAYKLESWNVGQSATLVYNDKYYGDAPSIKRIVVSFMDEEAASLAVKAGEADVSYTSSVLANSSYDNYRLEQIETNDSRGISLPCNSSSSQDITVAGKTYKAGNNVLCDFSIRYAMNLALDRDLSVKNALSSYGTPAYSVCDNQPWGSQDVVIKTDVNKAIEVLETSGWALNGDNNIREKDGKIATFNLYYASSDSQRQALAYDFANQMKEIGIEVNTIGAGWDEIYDHQYSDAVLWGWGTNSPSDFYEITKSDGNCNFALYSSNEADECLASAVASTTQTEAIEYYKQAQSYVTPEKASSWIWLANVEHLYFVRDGVDIGKQVKHPHGHGWSLLANITSWTKK